MMNLLFISAFQQGAHPAIVGLPQDARLAAVRPLTEPPPLISSTKQGGSITQVTNCMWWYTGENKCAFPKQF